MDNEKSKENKEIAVEQEVQKTKVSEEEDAQANAFLDAYGEKLSKIESIGRASINFEVLNALVGFPMDFLDDIAEAVNEFAKAIETVNSDPKKKKISMKIKDATQMRDSIIKFAFRLEGLRSAVLDDIQPDLNAELTENNNKKGGE